MFREACGALKFHVAPSNMRALFSSIQGYHQISAIDVVFCFLAAKNVRNTKQIFCFLDPLWGPKRGSRKWTQNGGPETGLKMGSKKYISLRGPC